MKAPGTEVGRGEGSTAILAKIPDPRAPLSPSASWAAWQQWPSRLWAGSGRPSAVRQPRGHSLLLIERKTNEITFMRRIHPKIHGNPKEEWKAAEVKTLA